MPAAHTFSDLTNQSSFRAIGSTFDDMCPPPRSRAFPLPITSCPSRWWISQAGGGFALEPLGLHASPTFGRFSGPGGEAGLVGGSRWPVGTVFEIIPSPNHFPSAQQSKIGSPGTQIRDAVSLLLFLGREGEAQRQTATCRPSPSTLGPE